MPQEGNVENGQNQQAPADNGQAQKPEGQSQQPAKAEGQKPPVPAAGKNDGMTERERGLLNETKKEREARQKLEKQVADLQANFERERKRVKLMLADEPQSEEEQEIAAVREQLKKVHPKLFSLTDEQIDRVLASTEDSGAAREVIDFQWQQHAKSTLKSLVDGVNDAANVELNPRQIKRVQNMFIATLEGDPELYARYRAGDPKLVEEFVADFVEDFITPAKRQATNEEVTRFRPVPRGGDRNVRGTPPKKIDFSDEKAVEDAMVASYKEHGGTFKR